MSYTKVISYGSVVEIYQYERSPRNLGGRGPRTKSKNDDGVPDILNGGQDTRPTKPKIPRSQRNIKRAKVSLFRTIVANLGGVTKPVFASLTYRDNMQSPQQGRKDFHAFVGRATRYYGDEFKHITVLEFQERGAVHFHSIIWGISLEAVKSERFTRVFAGLWRCGFADLVQTDGDIKIAGYLTNYLTETLSDPRMIGMKAFVASRNIQKPIVDSDAVLLKYFTETEMGDLSTGELLRIAEYDTQWLGRCHYQQFKRKEL